MSQSREEAINRVNDVWGIKCEGVVVNPRFVLDNYNLECRLVLTSGVKQNSSRNSCSAIAGR